MIRRVAIIRRVHLISQPTDVMHRNSKQSERVVCSSKNATCRTLLPASEEAAESDRFATNSDRRTSCLRAWRTSRGGQLQQPLSIVRASRSSLNPWRSRAEISTNRENTRVDNGNPMYCVLGSSPRSPVSWQPNVFQVIFLCGEWSLDKSSVC
jgi:hypothetical protein